MSEKLDIQKKNKERHSKVFEIKYKVFLKYLKWLVRCKQQLQSSKLESFLNTNFSINVDSLEARELRRKLEYLNKKLEEIRVAIEEYKNFDKYPVQIREIFHDVFIRVRFETKCTLKEFEKLVERAIEEGVLTFHEDRAVILGPVFEEIKKETLSKLEKQKNKIEESIKTITQKLSNEQT